MAISVLINHWAALFGIPDVLVAARGTSFVGNEQCSFRDTYSTRRGEGEFFRKYLLLGGNMWRLDAKHPIRGGYIDFHLQISPNRHSAPYIDPSIPTPTLKASTFRNGATAPRVNRGQAVRKSPQNRRTPAEHGLTMLRYDGESTHRRLDAVSL